MPVATVQTELPFLDLGDETRVNGDGKFFDTSFRWLKINNDSMEISLLSVGDLFKTWDDLLLHVF